MTTIINRDGKPVGIVRGEGETDEFALLDWFHQVGSQSMDWAIANEGYSVTEGEPDCSDVAALLEGIAARVGLTMSAEFVPFSRSRNAKPVESKGPSKASKPWRSLNWRIALSHRGREILSTDYSAGEAHAPSYKHGDRSADRAEAVAIEIETGKVAHFVPGGVVAGHKPVPAPPLGNVLQSLASDSDVVDAGGFESWARDYGYDTDSRSAEAIYRACLDIALKLRGELGERGLAELRLAASFN